MAGGIAGPLRGECVGGVVLGNDEVWGLRPITQGAAALEMVAGAGPLQE